MFRVCQKALDMWVFEVESRRHVSVQGLEGPKINAQSTKMHKNAWFCYVATPENVGFESVLKPHTLEVLVFFRISCFFGFVESRKPFTCNGKVIFTLSDSPCLTCFFQNMP